VRGYHVCEPHDLITWLGPTIYIVEVRGESIRDKNKTVVASARLLRRCAHWNDRTVHLFAASCARDVLPFFERKRPNDDRMRKCIEAIEAFAEGKVNHIFLNAAGDAAWDAAAAATRAAWEDAAWDAARAAAAAAAAAGDAARAAARAAWGDAAWDATRAAAAAAAAAGDAARAAAADAAWSAARAAAAAAAAAGDAARAAAWDATGDAAWDATRAAAANAAANAAADAAWNAARQNLTARLIHLLETGEVRQ
jgi:hypothetical protein